MSKKLWVWLEGTSDELFFTRIIEPLFKARYTAIHKNTYAQQRKSYTDSKIYEVMRSRAALEYLWLADLDPDRYPCVTAKKNATTCQHLHLQVDRIAVVAPEIEAWYLAGLDSTACEALRIPECQDTNSLTKEGFSKLIPTKYRSEIDFRMDVLDKFSVEVAKRKNDSFAYFCKKHLQVL